MDGDYEAPILAEPVGGPIPQWAPDDEDDTDTPETPAEADSQ